MLNNKLKVGLAILTCNRPEYFKQCIAAIEQNKRDIDYVVVVNDGQAYPDGTYPAWINDIIQHSLNKGVAAAKNEALRKLMENDCNCLFLIEDDILIQDPDVFKEYARVAKTTGICHFNFALHGPANLNDKGEPKPRNIVEYDSQTSVCLYPHCVGAFSFYLRGTIKEVGYFDERFRNAYDHVEHTYRIIKKGLHPQFWWFADIENSGKYLKEIPGSIQSSSIAGKPGHNANIETSTKYFDHKHGFEPIKIPDTSAENVLRQLEVIEDNFGVRNV